MTADGPDDAGCDRRRDRPGRRPLVALRPRQAGRADRWPPLLHHAIAAVRPLAERGSSWWRRPTRAPRCPAGVAVVHDARRFEGPARRARRGPGRLTSRPRDRGRRRHADPRAGGAGAPGRGPRRRTPRRRSSRTTARGRSCRWRSPRGRRAWPSVTSWHRGAAARRPARRPRRSHRPGGRMAIRRSRRPDAERRRYAVRPLPGGQLDGRHTKTPGGGTGGRRAWEEVVEPRGGGLSSGTGSR